MIIVAFDFSFKFCLSGAKLFSEFSSEHHVSLELITDINIHSIPKNTLGTFTSIPKCVSKQSPNFRMFTITARIIVFLPMKPMFQVKTIIPDELKVIPHPKHMCFFQTEWDSTEIVVIFNCLYFVVE